MGQPPVTPEMMRVVHEREIAQASRRARLRREAGSGVSLRLSLGQALVRLGVALGGERPRVGADPDRIQTAPVCPSRPVSPSATATGGA